MKSKHGIEWGNLLDFPYNKHTIEGQVFRVFASNTLSFLVVLRRTRKWS